MSKYTLEELMEKPIVVEVFRSNDPELISARSEDSQNRKFDRMSVRGAVDFALENYHKDNESNIIARHIKSAIEQLGDKLMLKVYDEVLGVEKKDGALVDERTNPINSNLYLRPMQCGDEVCLKASVALGESSDFDQGYKK